MLLISFDIGIRNLAVALLELTSDGLTVHELKNISLCAAEEKIPGLDQLSQSCFAALDELIGERVVHTVLLENQPVMKNPLMKSVQMLIYSYFQLRHHWNGDFEKILMVSATMKLKGHDFELPPTDKTGYKRNKWAAVELAKLYCQDDDTLRAIWTKRKADDLADALCQALSWIRRNLPEQPVQLRSV